MNPFTIFKRREVLPMNDEVVISGIPFYTQRLDAQNYVVEGFPTVSEAEHWSERVCGLACVKMAIAGFTGKTIPLYELLQQGLKMNAYKEDLGWVHQGLVDIAKHHSLRGGRESIKDDLGKIYAHLKKGEIVIPSVSPGLEGGKVYHLKSGKDYVVPRGGHLVVIYGATVKDHKVASLTLHHPSSEKEYEWKSRALTADEFMKSFSKNGNVMFISK
jgi:hypothetical protein